jgi:hypothetical protein
MPSIRKKKIQKRSRQQRRRQINNSNAKPDIRLELEQKKQQLDEERNRLDNERYKLEERIKAINDDDKYLDYEKFNNGGRSLKNNGNKRSKQQADPLLNSDVKTLNETDEQIGEIELKNETDLSGLDTEVSKDDSSQQGGCGFKKNMRPYPRSAAEKEEMRIIINQGLASGELKLGPVGPTGNQTIVNAQTGGRKPTQHRPVSLRTAVKLLKNYYIKRNN